MSNRHLYLLVDDHGGRTRQFEKSVATDDLVVKIASEAAELEDIKNDLEVLDGAIIDFDLNTSQRPDYAYLTYPCAEPACPHTEAIGADNDIAGQVEHDWHGGVVQPVNVTTGLGVMLFIKQHAPDVALYGFCELNADHSLLFLTAAHVWLGAGAINAQYDPESIQRALKSEEPEKYLPIHDQLAQAADGFTRLTDSLNFMTRKAEAIDWLGEYRFCGRVGSRAELERRLQKRFNIKRLEHDTYIEIMCRWQGAIARMLKAFNRDVSGWPELKNVTSVKHWDAHNPVLDFIQNGDYQLFFRSPDVRAALSYYRANEARYADDEY